MYLFILLFKDNRRSVYLQKIYINILRFAFFSYLCNVLIGNAQMAESVDALVSNTSGFTSMPVRSRLWVQIKWLTSDLSGC